MKNGYLLFRLGLLFLIGVVVTTILFYKAVKLDRSYQYDRLPTGSIEVLNSP